MTFDKHPFAYLLMGALLMAPFISFSNIADPQRAVDTITYKVVGAYPDSVLIEFTMQLDTLVKTNNGEFANQLPRYKIFVSYGDGTFENLVLYDTLDNGHRESAADSIAARDTLGARIISRDTGIIHFTYYHAYKLKPTLPVITSVAEIKTTDTDPPPKRQILIPDWIEKFTTASGSLSGDQLVIGKVLSENLRADALEARYYDDGSISDDTLHLNSQIAPITDKDYIWVLEIKGLPDRDLADCSILLHHNMGHYIVPGESVLDLPSIMQWKDEDIRHHDFGAYYQIHPDTPRQFSDVLEIDFMNLDTNEIRRFIITFRVPDTTSINMEDPDPFFFYSIAMESAIKENFKAAVQAINGDLFDVTVLQQEIDLEEGTLSEEATSAPDTMAVVNQGSTQTNPNVSIQQIRKPKWIKTPQVNVNIPESHEFTQSAGLQGILDTITGLLDEVYQKDYLRSGHDPNSIEIIRNCLPNGRWQITLHVELENYGFGGVNSITIKIDREDIVIDPNQGLTLHTHTFGNSAAISDITMNDEHYIIAISNIYLPGIRELALDAGLDLDLADTVLQREVENRYHGITRASISFKAFTSKLKGISSDTHFVTGQIIFEGQPPIEMQDTLLHRPFACGRRFSSYGSFIRVGYNYVSPFSSYDRDWSFANNVTVGVIGSYRPALLPIRFQAELSYNRWGFTGSDGAQLQYSGLEGAIIPTYDFSPDFSVGLGLAFLFNNQWESEAPAALDFTPTQQHLSGLLDFNGRINRFRIGLRGYFHPNAVRLNPNNQAENLFGAQLYLTYRWLQRYRTN